MDMTAIMTAKDEELQALGLIHRGDILALRAFAEKGEEMGDTDRVEKKKSLLKSLKEKFSGERLSKKSKNASPPAKKRCQSNKSSGFRKVYAGWQHYDNKKKRYISVRLINGGGMRDIDVAVNATKEELINQMKSVFFPDGNCAFGKTYEMQFTIGNFKCEEITDEGFTLSQYIARHRLSKCRIYILTKRYDDMIWTDSENEEDIHIPVPTSVAEDAFGTSSECNSLLSKQSDEHSDSLANEQEKDAFGTSSECNSLFSKQSEEHSDSLANEQEKDAEIEEMYLKQSEEEPNEILCKLRAASVPAEPYPDEDSIMVSVRHVSLGLQTRRFSTSNRICSIYDWVGSLSPYPSCFKLSTCDIAYLDPNMPVTLVDKTLIRMAEITETPTTRQNPACESFESSSAFNIPSPTELPEVILESEDV